MRGIVGALDIEQVHFVWNTWVPPVSAQVPAVSDLAQIPSIQLWCQRVGG